MPTRSWRICLSFGEAAHLNESELGLPEILRDAEESNMSHQMRNMMITSSVGREHGCLPGKLYQVDVTIARRIAYCWAVRIIETNGNPQCSDQSHSRRTIYGTGESLDEAVQKASQRAEAAGIEQSYLTQALSCASAEAAEEAEMVEGERNSAALSRATTEQLLAEIRARGITAAHLNAPV